MMHMPNFLIIGAAKAGTTSLHNALSQHPQIYMSHQKEPVFFAYETFPPKKFRGIDQNNPAFQRTKIRKRRIKSSFPITSLKNYQKLFSNVRSEIAIGETSPVYLSMARSIQRIQHYIPNVKIIAILRNPVDRAYSQYRQFRMEGHEPIEDFARALEIEPMRIQRGWSPGWWYKDNGFYYQKLMPYFSSFNRNQIRIYLYDNFCIDPQKIVKDIFQFLGVDEHFTTDFSKRYNASNGPINGPKSEAFDDFLNNPNIIKSLIKIIFPRKLLRRVKAIVENLNIGREYQFVIPPMSEDIRKQLQNEYREDMLKLQDLIGQDLSSWLK